jgi:hypothetical protein
MGKSVTPDAPKPEALIFSDSGRRRPNTVMATLLRRIAFGHVTGHSLIPTCRDGQAVPPIRRELIEQALARTIQNKAKRADRRGGAVERCPELMQA